MSHAPTRRSRIIQDRAFTAVCWLTAFAAVLMLGVLLFAIARQGVSHLSWSFLTSPPSRKAAQSGMGPAIWGTIWVCTACAIFALPLGIATAIFLEEYRPKRAIAQRLHGFIQLNIANLAGVPSIVYGILGLTLFVQAFGLFGSALNPTLRIGVDTYEQFLDEAGNFLIVEAGEPINTTRLVTGMTAYTDIGGDPVTLRVVDDKELDAIRANVDETTVGMNEDHADEVRLAALTGVVHEMTEPQRIESKRWYYLQLPFGRGVLAGALTLVLVILPIVIISSQEALRAVPGSLREGALALGATRWQMIRRATLPAAVPAMCTGSILAMSRAIGEAAPILVIAGIVYITFAPRHLMDDFTHMPLQIYNWAQQPQKDFHEIAATGIIVLLAILLTFNAAAVFIRQRFQKPMQ